MTLIKFRLIVLMLSLTAPLLIQAATAPHLANVRKTAVVQHHRAPAVTHRDTQPQIAAGSALAVDLQTRQILYSSRADRVHPIASLTKLMTAMVVLDAHLPLDEQLKVDISHIPEMRGVYSRLRLNSKISRRNMLLLALMSSENRAAASLANHYPGGCQAFIRAMNAKAKSLGMRHTHYAEPTGLSVANVSTARDLAKLVIATTHYPLIGKFSTTETDTASFTNPQYSLPFRNTNHLLFRDNWQIQLSKTGFTNAAGHCLVMRTTINHRPVVIVLLDAFGKYTHFADASRLRNWIEDGTAVAVSETTALSYKR